MGRRSRAEADRLAWEFEQSGLRRKEFCAARGLSGHTLDVWRRRVANSVFEDKIVPVEIIEDHQASNLGIDVALTTINDAVLRVGEVLIPIVGAMKRRCRRHTLRRNEGPEE
jgi:hypothetical protein